MIIAFRSRICSQQILTYLQWAIWALNFLVVGIFSFSLLQEKKLPTQQSELASHHTIDWEKMVTGPLALKENSRSALALALEQKFMFLGASTRPDRKKGEKVFCLGVRGSEERRIVKEGEPIFFTMEQHPSGGIENIQFSPSETGIPLVASSLDQSSLLLKIQNDIEVIVQSQFSSSVPTTKEKAFTLLEKAKWWGPDLFFRQYGGVSYQPLGQKHRLEFVEGKKRVILSVSPKDFLFFKDDKWQVASLLGEEQQNVPLAQVKAVSAKHLEIEAWNREGFSVYTLKMEQQRAVPCLVVPEKIFTSLKIRSAKELSCRMGKKRLVLKIGDWVIKTKNGWHKLKSREEIESLLQQESIGELLVVDSIDIKGVLKGHYFDEMHTQMQPISFSFSPEKKKEKPQKRGLVAK